LDYLEAFSYAAVANISAPACDKFFDFGFFAKAERTPNFFSSSLIALLRYSLKTKTKVFLQANLD